MKRRLLAVLLCLGAMFTTNMKSDAQGTLIHYWNFNSFTSTMYTPTITPVNSDFSIITSPQASVLYTALAGDGTYGNWNSYFDYKAVVPADFDTVNLRMGATPGNWARCRNPCDSMEFLWYMPTTGYTNLLIKYGTQASSISGASIQNYSYSLDSGATWKTSGGLSTEAFVMDTMNLSTDTFRLASVRVTDPAASNNPKFVFRITFQFHNVGATGNDRFDNISLDGDPASSIGLGVNTQTPKQLYTITPNPVTNSLCISGDNSGSKSVIIYNAVLDRVYTGTADGSQMTINTANLSPGAYIVSIRENTNGNVTSMKFIKQ